MPEVITSCSCRIATPAVVLDRIGKDSGDTKSNHCPGVYEGAPSYLADKPSDHVRHQHVIPVPFHKLCR
jgi:hypothetical protein